MARVIRLVGMLCMLCCIAGGGLAVTPEYVTTEALLKKAEISAEAVNGIDLEHFIRRNNVTVQDFPAITKEMLQSALKEEMEKLQTEVDLFAKKEIDRDRVTDPLGFRRFGLRIVEEHGASSLVADLENERIYCTGGLFFISNQENECEIKLEADTREQILNAFEDAALDQWSFQPDKNQMYQEWELALEYDEGVVKYKKLYADSRTLELMTQLAIDLIGIVN